MNNDQDNQQPNMNSVPPQPSFTPPPAQHPQQPVQQHQGAAQYQHVENPGQTLGIIGLVLNFFMINIGGIILGAISRQKSKKANMSTALGTVSLVWGIIGTVCGLLVIALFAMVSIASYNLHDRANKNYQESYQRYEQELQREPDVYDEDSSPTLEYETYETSPEESI